MKSYIIPIEIKNIHFNRALCHLRSSINLTPLSIFEKHWLGNLKTTQITLQLATRSLVHPKRVLEDMLAKVRSFFILTDFVILDFEQDHEILILLGRPFLTTSRYTIDLEKNELTMKINGEIKTLKCGYQPSKEDRRKLREHCKKLYIPNVLESGEIFPFINVERMNRFKEWDKWKKVKGHTVD